MRARALIWLLYKYKCTTNALGYWTKELAIKVDMDYKILPLLRVQCNWLPWQLK